MLANTLVRSSRKQRTQTKHLAPESEAFLAELTDAAYRVALRHGLRASFLDVQLDIWDALRPVVARHDSKPVELLF
jgi:hypothetical protein